MLVDNKLKFIFQLLIKTTKLKIKHTIHITIQNPNNPYILSKINSIDIIINTNTKSKYIIQLIIKKPQYSNSNTHFKIQNPNNSNSMKQKANKELKLGSYTQYNERNTHNRWVHSHELYDVR
jgi:ABC-type oligopeptide transport system ATPase subunit